MYLPSDHKCAIRQGFAASLLLTPLFFSEFFVEFLGSNEEGMGVECLYRGASPGRPKEGATGPLSRLWARPTGRPRGGACRPLGGRQAPLARARPRSGTSLQI